MPAPALMTNPDARTRPWIDFLAAVSCGVAAVPAGLLPSRRWNALHRLPIERMAAVSAILTMTIGLVMGGRGFLDYARRAASAANDATFELAARQIRGEIPPDVSITTAAPVALSALSLVAFVLFTPLGLFSLYLVISGAARAVSCVVDDRFGDPILTGLDSLAARTRRRMSESSRRRVRERAEGPEVPDRLFTGEWAGLAGVTCVVVSSRRKPGWAAGVFVITSDRWFTIGEPFDLQMSGGLRTAYPLREQTTNEVLRKGVRYELPPLERAKRRGETAPGVSLARGPERDRRHAP
jgi:hypothetical protein